MAARHAPGPGLRGPAFADAARALIVAVLLASVYLITYTGRIELGDQLEYFDAVGGAARFGLPLADEGMWQSLPRRFTDGQPPLHATIADPLFIHVNAPFYAAAERVTGVGLAHALWLFNAGISAVVGALVYIACRRFGAGPRASLVTALAFGILTIWWTYSQTFFREPLMCVWLMLAVLALYDVPRAPTVPRRVLAGITATAMLALSYWTKDVTLFALPGLALLVLPPAVWKRSWMRRAAGFLIAALAVLVLALIYTPLPELLRDTLPGGYLLRPSFPIIPETTRTALHTYALSIGGSVWGTSPVLLLAVPGAWLLWRRSPALVASIVLIAFGFVLGYGLLRGEGEFGGNWFGGTIWPQRFLLPIIPLLALLTVEVWPRLTRWPQRAAVIALCGYSLWWQLSSVVFNWAAYDRAVFDASFGLTYWLPGFNDLAYIRPVGLLRAIGVEPVNWAWARADILPYAALFGIPAALAALALRRRRTWLLIGVSTVSLVVLTFAGLRQLYDRDPFYLAERRDLFDAVEVIREEVPQGGAVLINSPETTYFWMNYGKVGRRWIVGLPYHPGDRGSFEQPVAVVSEDAREEIAPGLQPIIRRWAAYAPNLWLFMDSSPILAWSRRPFERYMGERYYRVGEREFSPYARLLRYDTHRAPEWDAPAVPQVEAPYTFTHPDGSGSLELLGYTIPEGAVPAAGGTFPVSLVWRADQPPTDDYTVALFVVSVDNSFIRAQGRDSWLGATFKTTTLLSPGEAVWDHRAVLLPDDWPDGPVRLWVKVYDFDPETGTITDLTAEGAEIVDGVVAVLPGEIP
ncbi:MAG: hypothetical protein IPM16_13420 [Chloroflexi bacterium]|nr:hypothetical protein [Chloroflexota bacterium]